MDIQQIEARCADLSIAEEENSGLLAPDPTPSGASSDFHCLVGRFLTERPIKFDHMLQVMASVWRPVMGVHAEALMDELFLFRFPHSKDLQRVLDDGPWSYENQIFVCDRVPTGTRPEDTKLEAIDFWVQIHGLPTLFASSDFLAQIGDYVGSFIAIDPVNFGGSWKSFLRIRVRLPIDTPLKRRMKLLRKDGSSQWINFRYERLNAFCFCCGLLGHIDKFCRKAYEENIPPEDFPFGSWMRAGPRRQVRQVGARWILQSTTQVAPIPEASGPSPLTLVTAVESVGL
ncbi:PREDICTED: uncharacterized protein At4g02000-like [Ipomoea nil]|uniref:uncharacterized protein At4g02000-like n=1 Tax=Ipomoea nil TaxID=35883 RepID=UPI000900F00F|nr:PREDICTED: uncharacterized protein At4g02000-like [Ipomoea nil]